MQIRALGVIPARYAASRLPGKLLADIAGKPMVQRVYERACRARHLAKIIVATDDERIATAVRSFGGHVQMTSAAHSTGSDRVAEVAAREPFDLIVNIQGDEPFIMPQAIDLAIQRLHETPEAVVGTLVAPINEAVDLRNPNVVKVALDHKDRALYFSRAPIPFSRDESEGAACPMDEFYFRHIGLYVFRRAFLLQYVKLPICDLERIEKLEQLRILKYGYRIVCARVAYQSICVDTPEDLARARRFAEEMQCES